MRDDNYWVKRLQSGRLTRRRFVVATGVAGVGAASLGLVGCGGDDDQATPGAKTQAVASSTSATTEAASPTATAVPKKGGVYNSGGTAPFNGVHPFNSVSTGSTLVAQAYNYLFRNSLLAPDKGNVMDLATKSAVQADNVTWVFTLRNDAKIAPNKYGVPERALDATDVKASFDFIADKATASNAYSFFNTWVDKTEVVDPQTFRLITKKPYAFTEASLGNWLFCAIAPKEWILKGSDQMKADSVGAGAFILKNLTESSEADMVPNPNYWDKGKPYLDQYSIKLFADQATYRAAFQSKQIDSYGPSDKDEGEALKKAEKGVIHTSDPGLQYLTFWMNTRIKPWDDPRARRAVNMAMDRQEYVQIIGKGGGEPIGPLSYAFKNEALPQDVLAKLQPFDVAGAKTLFEQAGVKELPFAYPTLGNTADYVNIFVRQMQAAGVTAKATALDTGTWLAQYFASTINASLGLNQTYNTPNDAIQWYHTGGYTGNGKYDTGFSDPTVDKAIEDAAGTLDPAARGKAYQDLQKLILSKDPALVNFFGTRTETVYRDFIQNYPVGLSSLGSAMTKTIWLDK